MTFTWADYAIIAIIALSVLVSLVRGFMREAISIVTWIVAFWVSFSFAQTLAALLVDYIHTSSLRMITSFAFLFIATLLLGSFVNFLVNQFVDKTGLSGTDRILGIGFGFARGVLVVALMLMLAGLTPMPENDWWKNSTLIPQFTPLEDWLHEFLPKSVEQKLDVSY